MVEKVDPKLVSGAEIVSSKQKINQDDLIFSLDIGTRTVIGVVGIEEKKKFKVLAVEVVEHKNRAMLDGQIHDITLVAEIVLEVKEKLEKRLGVNLEKVAIATAGRVLKTYMVRAEKELDPTKEITKEIISSLELEGIQLAQSKLESEQKQEEKVIFYCVGYGVTSYYLNGYLISSLLGHKGRKIEVEVLATFLPHVVIDSLYTVMNRVGLEVVNLTLEPIAAINVCIPQNLRLLNLVLVDIGAGTSDIAIAKDGAVVGYAMVPIAGDEITEKIAHHYLVDFNTAEKIKLALNGNEDTTVSFVDVLGVSREIDKEDIYIVIKETVTNLGTTIAEKILEHNQKAPNAVFCVGGGSQIKGLTEVMAEKLNIPLERVVVRGRDMLQSIKFTGKKLAGPEAITPLGIAVNAMQNKEYDFLSVTLNGKKIRLFNSKKLNVADALIMVGYDPKQLIGRTGKSINFEINGEKKTVRGEYGNAAIITVNGEIGNMETLLSPGDVIDIIPAVDGKPAKLTVSEIVDLTEKKITYNKLTIDITPKVTVNGYAAGAETPIHNGDKVEFTEINTIEDFAKSLDISLDGVKLLINNSEVDKDYNIMNGDELELLGNNSDAYIQNEFEMDMDEEDDYESYIDSSDTDDMMYGNKNDITADEEKTFKKKAGRTIKVSVNGKDVVIDGNKNEYVFVDIFNSMNFDITKVKGAVDLKLNNRPAGFTDAIKNGDIIDIIWDNN